MAQWTDPQPIHVPEALQNGIPLPESQAAFRPLLAELLMRRGVFTPEVARPFLDPACYIPTPAEELPDLVLAVQRLERAIAQGQRVAIWGDFDVDGQTATALYVQALRDLGGQIVFHIPSRRESHGVHPVGLQRLIDQGVQLLVTADTGIDARQSTALATRQGLEVLITDHHDLPPTLPEAAGIVNPKRLPAEHPLYELPGVGVAYQVVRALYEQVGRPTEHLLDLVALGIVADVSTMRGDIRYLLQLGLDALRRTERLGLKTMMALADLNPYTISEQDIGFTLAPRLNALSRVGEELGATAGVELLIAQDSAQARIIATALEALNAQRKFLVRETTEAVLAQLEQDRSLLDGPAIVVAGANWEPGVVGIVAGRLAEQFNRPAIVFSAPPGEIARGSARSVEGVDIHAAIAAQKEMLYRCGGHPMAAGLSLPSERIPEFRRALWRTLERSGAVPRERRLDIDVYLSLDQVSLDLAVAVNQLAPFGPGNDQPVFAAHNLHMVSSALIGRTQEHRRTLVRDPQGNERTFFWWHSADQSPPHDPFDLAFTVGINTFRGERTLQLTWVDARPVALPTLELTEQIAIQVIDRRSHPDPESALRELVTADRSVALWGEAVSVPGIPLQDRTALSPARTLIVWTAPPGPSELQNALQSVSPDQVILFGVSPEIDAPRTFLERLAGLVKHALEKHQGQTQLAALAAATAQREQTVRLGLEWMAQKGQIGLAVHRGGRVVLKKSTGGQEEGSTTILDQLQTQLRETAAYRRYFGTARTERLVGQADR